MKANAFKDINFNEKISYFPDGYRKTKGGVVSERALKHINELAEVTLSKIIDQLFVLLFNEQIVGHFKHQILILLIKQHLMMQ